MLVAFIIALVFVFLVFYKRYKPIFVEYYSHEDKCDCKYVINPLLDNVDDLFFDGSGPNWDTDINGNRYRKIYDPKYITSGNDVLEGIIEPGHTVPDDYTELRNKLDN